MIKLGMRGRDVITGFEGIVTGACQYISGCHQVLLVPKIARDGTSKSGEWFDIQRVERIGNTQIVLDNYATPGPDMPAPKR